MLKAALARIKRYIRFLQGKDLLQRPQLRVPAERHGGGYGGWVIRSGVLGPDSVVYSFGVGEDATFDLSLIHRYGLTVHAFDPTPKSVEWVNRQPLPERFVFHRVGIAAFDGTAIFHAPASPSFVSFSMAHRHAMAGDVEAPVERLRTIMQELGHTRLDLLKLDVEGAEYAVLEDILASGMEVRQVLVEFHHRFPSIGIAPTRQAIQHLNDHGYRIFSVSPGGEEFAFIQT